MIKTNLVLQRRNFLKTFAVFSAYSCLGGQGLVSLFVAKVAAQNGTDVGTFRMNLSDFPTLQNDFGSVRIKVPGMPTSFRQIIVTRVPDNQFFAVSSVCTHQGCTVNPYTDAFQALRCPCHGSEFDPAGLVIHGPATLPLTSYDAKFDGTTTVAIEIPGLGYSATIFPATNPTTGAARIHLEFPTVIGLKYEVRFRASLGEGDWTQVPFATSPDGATTQTVLNGSGANVAVFVDSTGDQGFYAIVRY